MKAHSTKIYPLLFAAMAFVFMVGMSGAVVASTVADGSDSLLLAKGGKRAVDDNPKPHGPLHKFREDVFDNDPEAEMMLVRELEPRRGLDAPRKPGDPRLTGSAAGMVLAKGRGGVDDNPKPHGPVHKFRDVVFDDDADDNPESEMILVKERESRRPDFPPTRRIDPGLTDNNLYNLILAREVERRNGLDDPRRPGDPRLLEGSREEMVMAKARGRVDDAPKPHGPTHKFLNDSSDDMILAKNKKNAPAAGAPVIDNPIKNAPHAPGAVHG